MRISDWSSDVCSSDLVSSIVSSAQSVSLGYLALHRASHWARSARASARLRRSRSEEHTSELQSLMRISYAVFCLKKKTTSPSLTPPPHHDLPIQPISLRPTLLPAIHTYHYILH